MNTTINFEFCDGTTVPLTLTFYALYQLKSSKRNLYNRYNEVMARMSKGGYDELDMITIVYTAYLCANTNERNLLTEEEFIKKCGADRVALGNAVKDLTQPKKQQAFDNRSNKKHFQENHQ